MNASEAGLDTKKRIIDAACSLFAQYGFEGTSIREIAKCCDVNLAAVNYHFKSKENLFWAVMNDSYEMADQFSYHYSQTSKDTLEFAMKLYDRFIQEKALLRNTMKMMLTEGMCPAREKGQEFLDRPLGPPGGKYLGEFIQKDVSYPLNPMGVMWGVKSVFCTIFHWSIMCQTDGIKKKLEAQFLTPDQIREDVRHMIKAHLAYLNANKDIFGAEKT